MSEVNTPRLMAAAKEFNIGTNTLIDFLVSKNFKSEDLKPTTKLTEEMYRVLQAEFQQDKAAKQKAEQLDLPKGSSAEQKKKKDEEDLSIKKKEEKSKATPAAEESTASKEKGTTESKTKEEAITKINAPELEGPKVLDKIDLASIDSSTRPKKGKKKEEEKPQDTTSSSTTEKKLTKEEASVTPKEEETNLPPVIENISIDKLSGPKILGKIELPVDSDTRPKRESAEEKQKRKRIPIQKKPGFEGGAQRGNKAIPDGRDAQGRPGQGGNRFQKNQGAGKKPEEKIIDAKEIQEKLKQT